MPRHVLQSPQTLERPQILLCRGPSSPLQGHSCWGWGWRILKQRSWCLQGQVAQNPDLSLACWGPPGSDRVLTGAQPPIHYVLSVLTTLQPLLCGLRPKH